MPTEKNNIGQRIRQIRKARLLTQEALSEQIEIDPKSLGRIEKGDYYPALDTLLRLSTALNVSVKDFFEDDESSSELNVASKDIRHALVDLVYSADEQMLISIYKQFVKKKQ